MSGRGFVDCPNLISSLTGRSAPLMEVVPPPKNCSCILDKVEIMSAEVKPIYGSILYFLTNKLSI